MRSKSPSSPALSEGVATHSEPYSPINKKEFCLDRSVMFMKRLEDEGKVCHMNKSDREMINMILLAERQKMTVGKEDAVFEKDNNTDASGDEQPCNNNKKGD